MTIDELLVQFRTAGITLTCSGTELKIQAPRGALTPEMRVSLTEHKQQLLDFLQATSHGGEEIAITCTPDKAGLREAFPPSDLQLGFLMADDAYMEFHVRPHYYIEKNFAELDIPRYAAAWNKALQYHAKDLAIVQSDGSLKVMEKLDPLPCDVEDLRGLEPADVEKKLLKTREEMMRQELPLDKWPWLNLRVSVWSEQGEVRYRVHYNHNNFFSDGYGTLGLLKKVESFYRECDLVLPPLELSYRDAVMTLDQLSKSEAGQKARRYWEDRLPTLPGPPAIPTLGLDRRCRSKLNRREYFLPPAVWNALKANARQHGLTVSNAIFAAYAELLSIWSNSKHFVVSNMMTRRLNIHPEINQIVGNFASLYPLEVDFREGGPFFVRARKLQEQVMRDAGHRAWGGMQIMQSFNRQTGGFGRAPIPFVIGSGLFMVGWERSDFSCLETSQVMLDHQFWELPDGRCYYVWDLLEEFFPEGVIDDMASAYGSLLSILAADADNWRQEAFDLLPARQKAERTRVSTTKWRFPSVRLESLLRSSARKMPEHPALIANGSELTYKQLDRASDAFADALYAAGARRGDTVAIVADRSPVLIEAVYGIIKVGAAYVPIDPLLPDDRRAYILKNSDTRHVIAELHYAERLPWPDGVQVITEGGLNREAGWRRSRDSLETSDLAYIIYTSGSTGRPKGVMIDHRGAVNTILDINSRFVVGSGDRILGVSSCGFDLSVYDLFGMVAGGATLVYPDPDQALNPSHWLDLMSEQRITMWNSAPQLAVLLVNAAELRGIQLPYLRLVLLSGDWIPTDLPERIRRVAPRSKIVSLGGATEASIWSIIYEIGKIDPTWPSIPYGFPMANQSWCILDSAGRPVPEWTSGDLYIGGVGLALGYRNDPEKTDASFTTIPSIGERVYRTGDLGRYRPGGVIEFLGRKDSQVKIHGHRIELGEIESILAGCSSVAAVAVVVQKTERDASHQLVAHIVPVSKNDINPNELREVLRKKLPDYMIPRLFNFIERMPLSANGKVDRRALPLVLEITKTSDLVEESGRPPMDEFEAGLQKIWCDVLKRDNVSLADDFFDLGGQSFEAVQMTGIIREVFGVSISIGDIWEMRTIMRLATRLRTGAEDGPSNCLVEINKNGSGNPFFLIHPAGGQVLCYRDLANRLSRPVFAFAAPGADGRGKPLESIPAFGRKYLEPLLKQQPKGPVLLGGWSSGATIAFELAVQLEAMGRSVEGIVIMDSPAPLIHDAVADRTMFEWFVGDLGLAPDVVSEIHHATAALDNEKEWLEKAVQTMRKYSIALGADIIQFGAIYRVFKGIVHGSRNYRPPQIRADLLVLRAEQGAVSEFVTHPHSGKPDWGWSHFTSGKIDTGSASATHYTLLREPAVDAVSQAIEQWIFINENESKTIKTAEIY